MQIVMKGGERGILLPEFERCDRFVRLENFKAKIDLTKMRGD
jgi:hypothetical protein